MSYIKKKKSMKLEREGRGWIWEGLWKGDKYDQNLLCENLKELKKKREREIITKKKKERKKFKAQSS